MVLTTPSTVAEPYDVAAVRSDFPILSREMAGGHPLVYLDSANTSQKPRVVIDTMAEHYATHNANVARAVHQIGEEATAAYEGARATIASFIGASSPDEVVFTKNASEALNLVANVLGSGLADDPALRLGPGDDVVISEMEHHSNIVPWQLVTRRTGANLRWFGLTEDGLLDLRGIEQTITPATKVVSVVKQSNILGTINDLTPIIARAREVGALVVVDAAQAVPHHHTDVTALGADLMAFTGHKMLGPTGIGVLWGRAELLEALPPFLGGGEMIETVAMTGSTFAAPPHRFEAGTPPIAEAIGLGAAVDYLTGVGMDRIEAHERAMTAHAVKTLSSVEGVQVLGPRDQASRGGTVSFTVDDVHPHDVGQLLDEQGIAVRVGHHCARPVCVRYGVPATTRASFYLYTTTAEIDALARGVDMVGRFFRR